MIISIISIVIVWLMAGTIKREREQHKKELQKLRNVYNKDLKTCKQEYTRLHNGYKAAKGTVRTELIEDIQNELKGLNGRVTTQEDPKRKQVLRNALEYLGGEQ